MPLVLPVREETCLSGEIAPEQATVFEPGFILVEETSHGGDFCSSGRKRQGGFEDTRKLVLRRRDLGLHSPMASITTEELLAHTQWLESGGKSGRKIDETGMNLAGAALNDLNLAKGQFVGTTFTKANLAGTNFAGADFSGANFDGADLSGVDFSGADLGGVSLRHANLTGANVRGADLSGANLEGANLTNADFTDADLIAANLTGAAQTGMKRAGAKLADTQGLVD
jgi:uncharacterized protein YjbI with pentapeptide repeats